MRLFVPCVPVDHPEVSAQNLISLPYCSWQLDVSVQHSFGNKNKRMSLHCRLFVLQTRGWGMLCFFGFLVGRILSELGGGREVQSKAIQEHSENLSSRLTWTLDLSLSHLGVLAFFIIQAMVEVPKGFYSKLLCEQLCSLFFVLFYIWRTYWSLFAIALKGMHICCRTSTTTTTYFMMIRG